MTCTGTKLDWNVPLPSCPGSLLPQQDMVPFRCRAQVWVPLAAMAVASVMPVTCIGTELDRVVSLPSWPSQLSPQQDMVPSWWSAQECPEYNPLPVVMAVASVMPKTCTGTEESASSPLCPLPSCPAPLMPQQDMVPFWWSAQECPLPAAMAVASEMPKTCTGADEYALPKSTLSPTCSFPSCPRFLRPQQDMVPSRWSAQECSRPAVMAVASVMLVTCTGMTE